MLESVFMRYKEKERKYVFEITSAPAALRDHSIIVHLMFRSEIKIAAVELVEKLGE